jgi:hypothetical protein
VRHAEGPRDSPSTPRRIVVDVDLEKFFDRVDHDILIDRLPLAPFNCLALLIAVARRRPGLRP